MLLVTFFSVAVGSKQAQTTVMLCCWQQKPLKLCVVGNQIAFSFMLVVTKFWKIFLAVAKQLLLLLLVGAITLVAANMLLLVAKSCFKNMFCLHKALQLLCCSLVAKMLVANEL